MPEAIVLIISVGWLILWVRTYSPEKIGGFIKHTIIFTILSILVSILVLFIIFGQVDETYSASNQGALGLLFIMWLLLFSIGCLVSILITLGIFLWKRNTENAATMKRQDEI